MKRFLRFVRTAIVGGFLLWLPIVLVGLLLLEMLDMAEALTDPLVTLFGIEQIVGEQIAFLFSAGVLITLLFLTGVLLETRAGARLVAFVERGFLDRLPGYALIKNLTRSFARVSEEGHFSVAAVNLYGDGTQVIGFIVDETKDGTYTIFVPNAPTPIAGSVYFVPAERVRRLNVSLSPAVNSLMQWGIGSAELLDKHLPLPAGEAAPEGT